MRLSKIKIKNYRLLINAELDVNFEKTLIVGRNNTAKTSFIDCIDSVLCKKCFSYNDYPLEKREEFYKLIADFIRKEISYDEISKKLPLISIEFHVDYSFDGNEDNLVSLSPFIIDLDVDITRAIIRAEYRLEMNEKTLFSLFEPCFYKDGSYSPSIEDARSTCLGNFSKIFGLVIYAVDPEKPENTQIKNQKELSALFPFYLIPAERGLGEDGAQNKSSLGKLITGFFDVKEEELDSEVAAEVKDLRKIIEKANIDIQKQSNEKLSSIVNKAVGFGYPNGEELQLAVNTKLTIDDQIKNQTQLAYTSKESSESLPSSHNGLGYKNLIKIEFLLALFAKEIEQCGAGCIPLLFIEEPESHMHPQMQNSFADYLGKFLKKISTVPIQTFLTSHSAHIANTFDFSKILYAQKTINGVIYKNLKLFSKENEKNIDFIKKYLTLSRCDLFFADKVIFVEGASERLLLPDMIEKCSRNGLFDSKKYKLPFQYYALIEIGGAYSNIFIPFMKFLDIPCLILTDLDPVSDRVSVPVSTGKTTSNTTIKWWMSRLHSLSENDNTEINLSDIVALDANKKTIEKCHIEFQTEENGLCGRTLEEAIINVNRSLYNLSDPVTEETIKFNGKSKTDFALSLIYNKENYEIPKYIKDGLVWLNEQNVLE